MPICASCQGVILFGGVEERGRRYCNARCRDQDQIGRATEFVTEEMLQERVEALLAADCPKCGQPGPLDVHTYHWVWSALVITTHQSTPVLCCLSCGNLGKLKGIAISSVLGWWGFPFGLIMTPIQIGRNVAGLVSSRPAPSPELIELARSMVAAELLMEAQEEALAEKMGESTDPIRRGDAPGTQ